MKFLRDILTSDKLSSVWDLVRVITGAAAVVGMGLQVFVVVVKDQAFDFKDFGIGLGFLLAAGGGAMWARRDREEE